FGIPFTTVPDRSDVPRSAARPLRYMDRYVTVNQGEVFYMTEALAHLEGLERGPAGNISLAAAFVIAQSMDKNQTIVVQETEYTGAGKHIQPQLSFARNNGIEIRMGNPIDEVPGKSIVLPSHPSLIKVQDLDLNKLRKSLIKNSLKETNIEDQKNLTDKDIRFLACETKSSRLIVKEIIRTIEP
ncbi:MAG: PLP-dependent lyase/thiolase, partial [Spirochaetales bacterium]|nr:PLP-dependent lyase/thiolase [Spirochaetales bacterium]